MALLVVMKGYSIYFLVVQSRAVYVTFDLCYYAAVFLGEVSTVFCKDLFDGYQDN